MEVSMPEHVFVFQAIQKRSERILENNVSERSYI